MLESALLLMMNGLLLMLRIAPGESFPKPLSREEERAYLERWLDGDLEARNKLVEHNLRLVAHIVKKYYQNDDADDLISIGSIGLIKGINTYKPDKGVRLATYASRCIENATLPLWNKGSGAGPTPDRPPRHALFRFSPLVGGRAFARAAVKLFNDGIDQRQLLIGGTGKAFYPGQKKIRMYAGNPQKQAPPMRIKQTKRQRPYPLWFCGASIEALTQAYACEAAERRRAPAPASAASSA